MTRTLGQWQQQIDAVANAALRGTPLEQALAAPPEEALAFARAFADDAGHRRAIDRPLLAWVLDLDPWDASGDAETDRCDLRLWRALRRDPPLAPHRLMGRPSGPLAPECRDEGLEVWTEVELASLQALWWHARQAGSAELHDRARTHARWLMDEIQPDNGTNHAWAVAAFAELAAEGNTDATLYAETLLHNCQVTLGRADLLSAVLLVDASRCVGELL
ncbi:MAG: hypothetical protein Q9O74_01780 [Planctomycetota bacterium]|nr:hypothetical protein [Planctomycetota bacterium]